MRRAKIVCTLGPAVARYEQVLALVDAGMDVARLNLSHGAHEDHAPPTTTCAARATRPAAPSASSPTCRARRSGSAGSPTARSSWPTGDRFTITTDDVVGTAERVSTTYKGLPGDVAVGDPLLVDDGKVALRVLSVEGPTWSPGGRPGPGRNNKGLNLPGVAVSVPALSDKDASDLRFALRTGVDIVALSFVRTADDVEDVREIMREEGVTVPVIAKIEKPQAVENLDEIVEAFDGIMVARGDLGVELPLEQVPLVQKRAVEVARAQRQAGHRRHPGARVDDRPPAPHPRRGLRRRQRRARRRRRGDALGRDQRGRYPIEAVRTMARIIENTEEHGLRARSQPLGTQPSTKGGAITLGGVAGRRAARRQVPRHLHPVRRLRAADVAAALAHPAAGLHARAAGAQPAGAVVGRGDLPGAVGQAHRRDGRAGRLARCSTSAGCSAATTW